jgi:ADP-ribosylglycohydrolase
LASAADIWIQRGYGPAVTSILEALFRGADYKKVATAVYPEGAFMSLTSDCAGSYANGGVMRIAPVGVAFRLKNCHNLEFIVSKKCHC